MIKNIYIILFDLEQKEFSVICCRAMRKMVMYIYYALYIKDCFQQLLF